MSQTTIKPKGFATCFEFVQPTMTIRQKFICESSVVECVAGMSRMPGYVRHTVKPIYSVRAATSNAEVLA